MKTRLFFLIAFLSHSFSSMATHNRAGYISVRYISDLTYEATITTYTKASSVTADRDTLNLVWGDGTIEKVVRSNGPVGTNGVPQGEVLPGGFDMKLNRYRSSIHTYAVPCDYIISVSDPNRISDIININGGASVNIPFYVETYLKSGIGLCENFSPFLLTPPIFFGNVNDTFAYNPAVMDADGDSLHFELVPPMQARGFPVPNYQYPDEVDTGSNNIFKINPISGEMTWIAPQRMGTYNVAVRISEFKNGIFYGYVLFDYQIIVENRSFPVPSFSTNLQADSTGTYIIILDAGDTAQFAFAATTDSLSATGEVFLLAQPATFLPSGTAPAFSGSFFWNPDSSHARLSPYITTFRASNREIIPFEKDLTVLIYVTGGTSSECSGSTACLYETVWPGDANSDGFANVFDILNIGLAYNTAGLPRTGASTNWIGQLADSWGSAFYNGVNYAHADCNGNGVIDINDVPAILTNYGLWHQKTSALQRAVDPDLFLSFSQDTFQTGDTVSGSIHLGSLNMPVNDVYGIAFSLAYNQNIIDTNGVSVEFVNSWLAAETERIGLVKDLYSASRVDIGISRTSRSNASGQGVIANVSFVIQDNIDGKDYFVVPLEIQFANVKAVNKDEAEVIINSDGDTLFVEGTTGIRQMNLKQDVRIFPNPAANEINVIADFVINGYKLIDLAGREIINAAPSAKGASQSLAIDLSALEQGSYFLHLTTADHYRVCRKIAVFR